ncbi:Colicin I receptor [Zhongshania aliphaticivorans]|uniref:Colicin I receptor n=1 Tax=Zhongshania aliphaticivorans TaxID=1470434 RepID=A0A5S9Q356_9GAMM|nr:TonB-dependent receptor [Zhongshania aliphaticivorans]CAA0111378.1 Colicin I receptor [Zhongshania aliphaticivorans]CAA0118597.1 Colicin I receptor [Zhongshania aliphaticivorans]
MFIKKRPTIPLISVIAALLSAANIAHSKQLEEVIVTAQKTSASTQDTPIAITGMTADSLEKFGFQNANDISAQVPNMQVSGPYGDVQPIFAIRGVSMSDYSSNQASPIGVYTDEMYMGATYTHGMNFFDVERLEVLRGPQGTLYGKNTTGGAVNIITNTANVGDEFGFNLKTGVGNYGATTGEFGVEDTIIDDVLALRLGYSSSRNDGYVENALGGPNLSQLDFQGARLSLEWLPSDATTVTFKYTNSGNDSRANASRNEPRGNLDNDPITVAALETAGVGVYNNPDNGYIDNTGYSRPANNLDRHEVQDDYTGALIVDNEQGILRIDHITDNYTFTSTTSYSEADYSQKQNTDGGPDGLLHIRWAVETDAFSQDFRVAGDFGGPVSFIAGLYYATEFQDMHNIYEIYETAPDLRVAVTFPGAAAFYPFLLDFGGVDQKMITDKTSYAAYSQFRFDATDQLGFDFGLRYTVDEVDLEYLNVSRLNYDGDPIGTWVPGNTSGSDEPFIAPSIGGSGPLELAQLLGNILNGSVGVSDLVPSGQLVGYTHGPYTTDSATQQAAKEQEITGKLGVDYAVNSDLMVYASFSKGYRAGNFNGGVYYEERDFENAYAEPEFIDAYELGFKSDLLDGSARLNAALFYYDYTNQQFINVVGVSNFLENAGGSTILGAEAEFTMALSDRLMLNLGIGLLKTEYTELELSDTRTLNNPDDTVDLSGNELISAPQISGNISLDYDVLRLESGDLILNVNANYQSKQWYSAYNDDASYEHIKQDPYALINTRLSWHVSDDSYSLSLWAKNLMDEEYDGYAINLQAGFGFDYFQQGPPRTYGLEFTYRYQ